MGMAENCTWMGSEGRCKAGATHPQIGKDGNQWANLCAEHAQRVDSSIENFDAKNLLGNWVRAQGGSKAAAARMVQSRL